MADVNWIDVIFDIWDRVVLLLGVLWEFLFKEYTINLPEWLNELLNIPDITFGMWAALGGVGIVAIILWGLFR